MAPTKRKTTTQQVLEQFQLPSTLPVYRLNGRVPVKCKNVWEHLMSTQDDPRVAFDKLSDDVEVSTVFIPVAFHRFDKRRTLLHFETMVFGGPTDQQTHKWATWDEAVEGHKAVVALTRAVLKQTRRGKGKDRK